MRKLLLLGLVLALMAGCKKANPTNPTPAPAPSPQASGAPAGGSGGPGMHAPTGVVLNPGIGGGGGGAVQGVRMAVKRVVNEVDLKQIQVFVEAGSGVSGQVPTKEEITAALQKEAPKIYKQIQDGAIVLTGTRTREHIWAYTADPQSIAGYYLILSSGGVEKMDRAPLEKRLKQEEGR
jgi:hypothetical protein